MADDKKKNEDPVKDQTAKLGEAVMRSVKFVEIFNGVNPNRRQGLVKFARAVDVELRRIASSAPMDNAADKLAYGLVSFVNNLILEQQRR